MFRILWAVATIYFTYNLIHFKYKPFIALPDPTEQFLLQHCKNKTISMIWLLTLKLGLVTENNLLVPSFEPKNVILGLLQNILSQLNVVQLTKNYNLNIRLQNLF